MCPSGWPLSGTLGPLCAPSLEASSRWKKKSSSFFHLFFVLNPSLQKPLIFAICRLWIHAMEALLPDLPRGLGDGPQQGRHQHRHLLASENRLPRGDVRRGLVVEGVISWKKRLYELASCLSFSSSYFIYLFFAISSGCGAWSRAR